MSAGVYDEGNDGASPCREPLDSHRVESEVASQIAHQALAVEVKSGSLVGMGVYRVAIHARGQHILVGEESDAAAHEPLHVLGHDTPDAVGSHQRGEGGDTLAVGAAHVYQQCVVSETGIVYL